MQSLGGAGDVYDAGPLGGLGALSSGPLGHADEAGSYDGLPFDAAG